MPRQAKFEKRATFMVPATTDERISVMAKKCGVSASEMYRFAVQFFLMLDMYGLSKAVTEILMKIDDLNDIMLKFVEEEGMDKENGDKSKGK